MNNNEMRDAIIKELELAKRYISDYTGICGAIDFWLEEEPLFINALANAHSELFKLGSPAQVRDLALSRKVGYSGYLFYDVRDPDRCEPWNDEYWRFCWLSDDTEKQRLRCVDRMIEILERGKA